MDNQWNILVIALCSILVVVLLITEFRRRNKQWLAGRLVATVLAIAALAFLTTPVYVSTKMVASNNSLFILTEGYNEDSVQAYAKQNPQAKIYQLTGDGKHAMYKSALPLPNLFALDEKEQQVRNIYLFGYGADTAQLAALRNSNIKFIEAAPGPGVQSVYWNKVLFTGETLQVQGMYQNNLSRPVKLGLAGFTTMLDSVSIPAKSTTTFRLHATPRHNGPALYNLVGLDKKDTIITEPLPVEVKPGEPVKLLMLAASPDFETKFLKNWLADNGYQVAVRTLVSKNKFVTEYVNLSGVDATAVNAGVLSKFDIILADAEALKALGREGQATLQQSVSDKGLGLIIRADSSFSANSFYQRYFNTGIIPGSSKQSVQLKAPISQPLAIPALAVEKPLYLPAHPYIRPLINDVQNRAFAATAVYGNGRLVASTLTNTWQWMLAGEKEAYRFVWSTLLNEAAKPVDNNEDWRAMDMLPLVNRPVTIRANTSGNQVPVGQIETTTVAMQQNSQVPNYWYGTFWPRQPGWHAFIKADGSLQNWYVYDSNDFKAIQAKTTVKATKDFFRSSFNGKIAGDQTGTKKEPVSKGWFFAMFVLSAGFLWLERKLV